MALIENTDFSQKQQVDLASIASLYQQKKAMEAQMKLQQEQIRASKQDRFMQIMNLASNLTSTMINQKALQQQKMAQAAVANTLGKQNDLVPTGLGEGANVKIGDQMQAVPTAQMGAYGETPEFQTELMTKLQAAAPEEMNKALIEKILGTGEKGATGRPQLIRYSLATDPNKSLLGFADPNTRVFYDQNNKPIDQPIYAAYAMGFGEDPGTGAMLAQNRSTGGVNQITTPSQVPFQSKETKETGGLQELRAKAPDIAKKVEAIRDDSYPQTNKALETQINGATAAAQVNTILKSEGDKVSQVGLQSLGFYFARMAGSNSQLSDKEREVFEQPLSLVDRVANKGYKLAAGDLTPKMKRDLLNLSNILEKKSKLQAKRYLSSNMRKAKESAGTYWNKSVEKSFPTYEELVVSTEEMMGAPDRPSLDSIFGD